MKKVRLDQLDLNIIEILRRDGRATYASMAQTLGQKPNKVRHRVQRLQESGALHFLAYPNPKVVAARRSRLYFRVWTDGSDLMEVTYARSQARGQLYCCYYGSVRHPVYRGF